MLFQCFHFKHFFCLAPSYCAWILQGQEDSSRGSDNSSYDEALSPTSPGSLPVRANHGERDLTSPNVTPSTPDLHGINPVFLSSNPSRWSVEEVYEFIASLQGEPDLSCPFSSWWEGGFTPRVSFAALGRCNWWGFFTILKHLGLFLKQINMVVCYMF